MLDLPSASSGGVEIRVMVMILAASVESILGEHAIAPVHSVPYNLAYPKSTSLDLILSTFDVFFLRRSLHLCRQNYHDMTSHDRGCVPVERLGSTVRQNWHMGFTSFGGPPVHFKIVG